MSRNGFVYTLREKKCSNDNQNVKCIMLCGIHYLNIYNNAYIYMSVK